MWEEKAKEEKKEGNVQGKEDEKLKQRRLKRHVKSISGIEG